jgi:hypothetical protein
MTTSEYDGIDNSLGMTKAFPGVRHKIEKFIDGFRMACRNLELGYASNRDKYQKIR